MHNKKKRPHLSLKFKTIIKPEKKILIIVPNSAIRKKGKHTAQKKCALNSKISKPIKTSPRVLLFQWKLAIVSTKNTDCDDRISSTISIKSNKNEVPFKNLQVTII